MALRDCCSKYVRNAHPRQPKSEEFVEIQICPTCQKQIGILFEEVPLLDREGETEFKSIYGYYLD